jgi:hypothetical protein
MMGLIKVYAENLCWLNPNTVIFLKNGTLIVFGPEGSFVSPIYPQSLLLVKSGAYGVLEL